MAAAVGDRQTLHHWLGARHAGAAAVAVAVAVLVAEVEDRPYQWDLTIEGKGFADAW